MKTVAIFYDQEGHNTSGRRLMDPHPASEGFLKGLVRHSSSDCLYVCTKTKAEFEQFQQKIKPWTDKDRQLNWISLDNPLKLARAGTYCRPDPIVGKFAWQRRYFDQKAYSICGITHTITSQEIIAAIGDLAIAPVQPWDAVICTSTAVKTSIEGILNDWGEYLAQRIGNRPKIALKLPVIPLGIDSQSFAPSETSKSNGRQLREKLGIEAEDVVVLSVGKLIFHSRAYLIPLYLAIEKAAQETKSKIHLIQTGWFEDRKQEFTLKNCAETLSPNVNHIFVDGTEAEIRSSIWSVADIFVSLADNIQEAFSLSAIEAMAAGLPVIVSDWDGYKDMVRHQVDGFRIPSIAPAPGNGLDLAANYFGDRLNHNNYINHTSIISAIDVEATANALTTLFTQPELRQKMGENGQKRAKQTYDWRAIVPKYEDLWQELSELRSSADTIAPITSNSSPHPLCDDPFHVFAHYPSQQLRHTHLLSLGQMSAPEKLHQIRTIWMTNFDENLRSSADPIDRIIIALAEEGSLSVEEILNRYSGAEQFSRIILTRTLVYLLKFNVLRLL